MSMYLIFQTIIIILLSVLIYLMKSIKKDPKELFSNTYTDVVSKIIKFVEDDSNKII